MNWTGYYAAMFTKSKIILILFLQDNEKLQVAKKSYDILLLLNVDIFFNHFLEFIY